MRDIFYRELQNVIKDLAKETITPTNIDKVIVSIQEIIDLSNIGRKEGLLSLEYRAIFNTDIPIASNLRQIIMLTVDGTDPDLLEEICLSTYISSNLTGIDALIYLIYFVGGLAIQNGENPRVIEEKLLALTPQQIRNEYKKRQEEAESHENNHINHPEKEEIDMSPVEKWYAGDTAFVPTDDGYYSNRLFEYVISSVDDRNIQRWLRDVDNCDLTVAMRGVSGITRQIIFKNMSKRLALMIAEDMDHLGDVRIARISEAIQKILTTMLRLMSCDEVVCPDSKAVLVLNEIFKLDKEQTLTKNPQKNNKINELRQIFWDYEDKDDRIITP